VQAIFLAVGVAWMLLFSGLFGLLELTFTRLQTEQGATALAVLRDPAVPADEARRALRLYDGDGRLIERLDSQLTEDRDALARRLQGANRVELFLYNLGQQFLPTPAEAKEFFDANDLAEAAERVTPAPEGPGSSPLPSRPAFAAQDFRTLFHEIGTGVWVVLLFWPALWVTWAFLTRGGLTLSLTGLALVRIDGRKAPRWRCGWRALLVWAPVVAPLAACIWVKVYAPQLRLVHTGLWWLAVAVLVSAVVLAVRRPQQAPHDRLAGTCLVPR
jgi:hypothetical protein